MNFLIIYWPNFVYLLVNPGFLRPPPIPNISTMHRGSFIHRMDAPDRHNGQRDKRTNERTDGRTVRLLDGVWHVLNKNNKIALVLTLNELNTTRRRSHSICRRYLVKLEMMFSNSFDWQSRLHRSVAWLCLYTRYNVINSDAISIDEQGSHTERSLQRSTVAKSKQKRSNCLHNEMKLF